MKSACDSLFSIIDAIPAPVFFKDKSGKYLGCNRPFENFIGKPREQLIGYTAYDIAPRDLADTYSRADRALFLTGGVQIYESSVSTTDGMRRNVVFNKAVFTMPNGNVGGLVGVILDVTDRKLIESHPRGALDLLPDRHREISFLRLLTPHLHTALTNTDAPEDEKSCKYLTQREREVLTWVCAGKTNSEIASILGISSWTVKIHVANVLAKLNATTRGHAASKAISLGLVETSTDREIRTSS